MQALTQLKKRREELNLTQEQFADQVGVEAMTVSRWERGESLPRRKVWTKLQEITGLRIAEIIAPALEGPLGDTDDTAECTDSIPTPEKAA